MKSQQKAWADEVSDLKRRGEIIHCIAHTAGWQHISEEELLALTLKAFPDREGDPVRRVGTLHRRFGFLYYTPEYQLKALLHMLSSPYVKDFGQ